MGKPRSVAAGGLDRLVRGARLQPGLCHPDRDAVRRHGPTARIYLAAAAVAATQTYGGDPGRGLRIVREWIAISFSDARGSAPRCSIGCRRSRRRTSPIPMRRSFALPAPGCISSTRRLANSSARIDAAGRRGSHNTAPFKFTFVHFHQERISVSRVVAPGRLKVTGSNGELDCAG